MLMLHVCKRHVIGFWPNVLTLQGETMGPSGQENLKLFSCSYISSHVVQLS